MFSVAVLLVAHALAAPCSPLSNYLSSIEMERAVSMMPDTSCSNIPPSYGCVDAQCRKCKIYDTMLSSQYIPCPSSLLPSIYPPDNITCTSYLFSSEPQAGVSAMYDASCTLSGGYGCLPDYLPCRRCSIASPNTKNYLPCGLDQVKCLNKTEVIDVIGITDLSCLSFPTLPGCNQTTPSSCRLCRLNKHIANAHLLDCTTLYALTTSDTEVFVLTQADSMNTMVMTLTDSVQHIVRDVGLHYLLMETISCAVLYGLIVIGVLVAGGIVICIYHKCTKRKNTIPSKPILLANNQLVIAV